jgi:hypothetical protein
VSEEEARQVTADRDSYHATGDMIFQYRDPSLERGTLSSCSASEGTDLLIASGPGLVSAMGAQHQACERARLTAHPVFSCLSLGRRVSPRRSGPNRGALILSSSLLTA